MTFERRLKFQENVRNSILLNLVKNKVTNIDEVCNILNNRMLNPIILTKLIEEVIDDDFEDFTQLYFLAQNNETIYGRYFEKTFDIIIGKFLEKYPDKDIYKKYYKDIEDNIFVASIINRFVTINFITKYINIFPKRKRTLKKLFLNIDVCPILEYFVGSGYPTEYINNSEEIINHCIEKNKFRSLSLLHSINFIPENNDDLIEKIEFLRNIKDMNLHAHITCKIESVPLEFVKIGCHNNIILKNDQIIRILKFSILNERYDIADFLLDNLKDIESLKNSSFFEDFDYRIIEITFFVRLLDKISKNFEYDKNNFNIVGCFKKCLENKRYDIMLQFINYGFIPSFSEIIRIISSSNIVHEYEEVTKIFDNINIKINLENAIILEKFIEGKVECSREYDRYSIVVARTLRYIFNRGMIFYFPNLTGYDFIDRLI